MKIQQITGKRQRAELLGATDPEDRAYGVEIRNVETNGSLTMLRGRAVPYGVKTDIGWFLESFAAGSLGDSARGSAAALPLLLFHDDMKLPIGAASEWDEQADGLYGVWRLAADELSQQAAQQARDGFLNFMSVRFQPIRSTWTWLEDMATPGAKDEVVREEARLIEVSLVSTPAYNDATVTWVRSAEHKKPAGTPKLEAWKAELARIRGGQ